MAARTHDLAAVRAAAQRIKPLSEVPPHPKVLAYGPNGSGKTRFAASSPRCLIIDIDEEGTRSVADRPGHYFPAESWADIGDMYWYLKSGKHKFQTVALDTISAMNSMSMRFVLGEQDERDPSRERSMPDKRTYGRSGELMKAMMLAYRNLPMNVIFLAQVRVIRDDDTGEVVERTVDLPAGARGTAMGCASVIGYMSPKEVRVRDAKTRKITKRWVDHMLLGPHEEYPSLKDRTNQLGPIFRNPSMPKVIEAWANIDPDEE